jgi:hypothetical protein
MDNLPLPPELERVERFLARGPRPAPSASLRRRILGDVRSELRRERLSPRWRFAAVFAATVLVELCLSLSIMQAVKYGWRQRETSPAVVDVARQLQQLSPGLSHEESLRQAKLRQSGVGSDRRMIQAGVLSP